MTERDDERWEVYQCLIGVEGDSEDEGQPASVRFSATAGESAPDPSRPHRVDVSVRVLDPTPFGFPTREEAERLWALEDLLEEAAAPTDASLVAVLTSGARREWFFHTSDGPALASSIRAALERAADTGDRDVRLEGYADPEWRYFLDVIWPDTVAWRYILDRKVLQTLAEHGDDGTAPRPIQHFAYFADPARRDEYVAFLRGESFERIEALPPNEGDERPYGVTCYGTVAASEISPIASRLAVMAEDCDGEYDGWESPVVTPKS